MGEAHKLPSCQRRVPTCQEPGIQHVVPPLRERRRLLVVTAQNCTRCYPLNILSVATSLLRGETCSRNQGQGSLLHHSNACRECPGVGNVSGQAPGGSKETKTPNKDQPDLQPRAIGDIKGRPAVFRPRPLCCRSSRGEAGCVINHRRTERN